MTTDLKTTQQVKLYLVFILLLLVATPVLSASPYRVYSQQSLIALSTGASLGVIGRYAERNRAEPGINEINGLERSNIPAFDRFMMGGWDTQSQKLSDVLLYGSPLAVAPHLFMRKKQALTIATMYMETMALSIGGTYFSKGNFVRYRPYTYSVDAPLDEKTKLDATRSFFSGHAAVATSSYIFSAKVFSDYNPDSRYRSLVWAGAVSASVATAALRVKGGMHFVSDVSVGLLWGGLVGYFIPEFHKISTETFSISPVVTGDYSGLFINYIY